MRAAATTLALVCALVPTAGARELAHMLALDSIRADEALATVEVLADDALEGRSAGSRGGRAAAAFLVERLTSLGWTGAAEGGGFYQEFGAGRRNILALRPGADPRLAAETIVVGAHYDHVGYGDRRTSFGPIGHIHNGADDNASGVAAVLEMAEALARHGAPTRRSLLIAFWDAEELGLLGSKHWVERPTVPLGRVPLAINLDMVGRMREGRVEVVGARTGYGLRRLASQVVDPGLWADFTWEMEPNSDHWTFIQRRIPTLMLHTGLHDEYHRPSDDVERINPEGIRLVSRYLFDLTVAAADAETLPSFRAQSLGEKKGGRAPFEQPLPPLPDGAPRPRVGVSWREDDADPGVVFLTRVVPGTPAAQSGLAVGDRVVTLDGAPAGPSAAFERRLAERLAAGGELPLVVERCGRVAPAVVTLD